VIEGNSDSDTLLLLNRNILHSDGVFSTEGNRMSRLNALVFVVLIVAVAATLAGAQQFKPDPDRNLERHCTDLRVLRGKDGKVVWFNHEQMKAMAVVKVVPEMPGIARSARLEGTATLNVCVGSDGIPHNIWVISGHPLLLGSAIDAAQKWRFRPYTVDSNPIAFAGTLQFTFSTSKGNSF
jgi:TonB family protein